MSNTRSFLGIAFGLFAGVSLLGIVAMGVAAWVLDRSLTAMLENITSDTGWLFAEVEAYEEEAPSRARGDEEEEEEEAPEEEEER